MWAEASNDTRNSLGRFKRKAPMADYALTCHKHESMFQHMSKMIQLRNVPDALHRTLKASAAMAGMSLSDYLLREIKEIAERPTLAEFRARLHQHKPVAAQIDTARLVREDREPL
jgi:antitoxin FitA